MLIVWKGKGFLVAVVVVAALVTMQLAADGIGGAGTYAADPLLWAGVALLTAGAPLSWWGRKLKEEAGHLYFDPKTHEPVAVGQRNTMFFLPVHIWALACLGAGALLATAGVVV